MSFKKTLTLALAIIMLVGLIPATAMAIDPPAYNANVAEVDNNGFPLTDGPDENKIYLAPAGVRCFYIDDVSGNDTNDGLSPSTAWQTSKRASQATYLPGDHILYKRGGTFIGKLAPKGSGTAAAPIVIASYGEGPRPILRPLAEGSMAWPGPNATTGTNPTIGTVLPRLNEDYVWHPYWYVSNSNTPYYGVEQIGLYNVQHYEVRDLELYDPNFTANQPPATGDSGNNWYTTTTNANQRYRRGILVYNEDAGHLRGFTFDNLVIHGYRGTNSNRGKSSGGIIIQTNTSNVTANRRGSGLHDIYITNCWLYNLGRDAINFTSPWTARTYSPTGTATSVTQGDTWGTYGYPSISNTVAGWLPSENVYVSNNIMHDIDGDGTIIDGCIYSVMENNLVYRTEWGVNMAVGIFTWNSDFSTFQFNESHNAHPADSRGPNGDGQGMEIDAICRDTIMQYNYTHNNWGGWMMNCSTGDLRNFRNVWRYNISQYDGGGTSWGIIEWRQNVHGMRIYNNTVVWNNSNMYFFSDKSAYNTHSDAVFFNNLFYYAGGGQFPSNRLQRGTGTNVAGTMGTYQTRVRWFNNCFYNFPSTLTNTMLGNTSNLILTGSALDGNPLLVAPGTGAQPPASVTLNTTPINSGRTTARGQLFGGSVPSVSGVFESLRGYTPKENSPLIGAGIEYNGNFGAGSPSGQFTGNANITFLSHDPEGFYGKYFNGGRDFFGTPLLTVDAGVAAAVADHNKNIVPVGWDDSAYVAAQAVVADARRIDIGAVQYVKYSQQNLDKIAADLFAATYNMIRFEADAALAAFGVLNPLNFSLDSWANAADANAALQILHARSDATQTELVAAAATLQGAIAALEIRYLKLSDGQPASINVRRGTIVQIAAETNGGTLTYTSAVPIFAAVDSTGKVTGLMAGISVIRITEPASGLTINVAVNVVN